MTPTENNRSSQLLRLLGVGFGVAVTIGGTIGTGILRRPGTIAQELGQPSLALLVWALVGIYALVGSLQVIELGTLIPKAGGWYVFAHRAFGDYFGFVIGISSWLGSISAMAFGAAVMGEYIALLQPDWSAYIKLMAIGILAAFTVFHWFGVRLASRAQEVMSFIKAVGLLAFVAVCFFYTPDEPLQFSAENTLPIEGSLFVGILAALQSVFYTYDGWHTAAYFTEEDVNPNKNLPRSMMIGVLLIVSIYLLVNLALFYVLPIERLAQSKLPAADAIQVLFGPASAKVVTLLLMISIMGIINAQIMFNPRVLFAISRDGLFARYFTRVNSGGTPGPAMFLTAGMSILMILTGTYSKLSDVASFFFVLCYAAAFASLIRLRQIAPELPRPFLAWGYPLTTWLMMIISLAFLAGVIYSDPSSSAYAVGFIILSYPLFLLVKRLNR
ncbi:APC family permease [Larkinella arboricola]|uniref:APA family basic amino acid/polyamine antiporter n=1 Tax=Larkinella arboricola TaxID=643671 RepID=A0A327WY40_LARAB|nr:amino acid permease [Larkinella arboricola]RAJ98081.1 APA family basic amino acid/polyamine antiporter [Larkinella arboricola]